MKSFVNSQGKYYEAESPLNPDDIEIQNKEEKKDGDMVLNSASKIQLTPAHLWVVIALCFTIAGTYYNNLQRITALEESVKKIEMRDDKSKEELRRILDKLGNRIDDIDSILYNRTLQNTTPKVGVIP